MGLVIEFLQNWIVSVWVILGQSGPYLLLGFTIAGFIKVLLPEDRVFRHLGNDNFRSVWIASICGAPIPLCSCSVVPTAMALKKAGASKGATTSFLIATPETGVDSMGVTYALMDPWMTIARPIAALVTALGAGTLVNRFARGGSKDPLPPTPSHCCAGPGSGPGKRRGLTRLVSDSLRFGFGKLLDDLAPWFVVGFLVSGLLAIWMPDDFFDSVLPGGWVTSLTMLVVGVPFYVCATASTPIAAAMIAKGLDPGAALVFLLAGPATNLATMTVVNGFLGRRVLGIYLLSIASFALLLGALVNFLYDVFETAPTVASVEPDPHCLSATHWIGGSILGVLLLQSLARKSWIAAFRRARFNVEKHHEGCHDQ